MRKTERELTELRAMSRRKVIDKKITKGQMDMLVLLQRKLQLCWQQRMELHGTDMC